MGVGGQRNAPAALLLGKTRYPLYRRLGGAQGRSGRAENLVLTGIRSPDRPTRGESLYGLSYPGPYKWHTSDKTGERELPMSHRCF